MATESSRKKVRRLKAAPQTMRERAERASGTESKQSRVNKAAHTATAPIRKAGRGLARVKLWKPLRITGQVLAKLLVPPYIRGSFKELRLVTWPNRKQTFQLTFAVLLFAVAAGTLIAIIDFGLDKLFKQVILR